jgi:hypothetical protein
MSLRSRFYLIFVSVGMALLGPSGLVAETFSPLSSRGLEFGTAATIWRFAGNLLPDRVGAIQFFYQETNKPPVLVGSVDIVPTQSGSVGPDLRVTVTHPTAELHILFSKVDDAGEKKNLLIASYGIHSGVFIFDFPKLAHSSIAVSGSPHENSSGETTLLGVPGNGSVTIRPDGTVFGGEARLFFTLTPSM